MNDDEKHVHFCDCEDCMNRGGGDPVFGTLVTTEPPAKTPELLRNVSGTARAEVLRADKRKRSLRRQLGNGTGQP